MHEARTRVPSSVPRFDPLISPRRVSDGANHHATPTGEILFERIRPSNGEMLRCELRCCRESGWELRFFSGSSLLCSYGGFGGRGSAVRFAESVRGELKDIMSAHEEDAANPRLIGRPRTQR